MELPLLPGNGSPKNLAEVNVRSLTIGRKGLTVCIRFLAQVHQKNSPKKARTSFQNLVGSDEEAMQTLRSRLMNAGESL